MATGLNAPAASEEPVGDDGAREGASAVPAEAPASEEAQPDRLAELEARLAAAETERDTMMRLLERRESGTETRRSEPATAPDPRAADLQRQIQDNERELEESRLRIQQLAQSDDPMAKYILAQEKRSAKQLELITRSLIHMDEQVQILEVPDTDRAGFKAWHKQHGHRFADMDAARMAFEGLRAREEKDKPKPKNPTAPAAPGRRPVPPGPRVDTSVSTRAPSRRDEVSVMSTKQFDDQIDALREAGRYADARALQGRLRDGEIDLRD